MPTWQLFTAALILFTLLFPGRILHVLHIIKAWLASRRIRKQQHWKRSEEVRRSIAVWKEYLDTKHEKLLRLPTLEGHTDELRHSLAAAERFLLSISPDESPGNYKRTQDFCKWAKQTLAEMDRREQQ